MFCSVYSLSFLSKSPVLKLSVPSLEQNGFDYLLTYSDNPQTVFPRYCVSWMVSSGELVFFLLFRLAGVGNRDANYR